MTMIYSIAMVKPNGDLVCRAVGTDFEAAKSRALDLREDFPEAKTIRVVSLGKIHFTC